MATTLIGGTALKTFVPLGGTLSSDDGQDIAFVSPATNLVASDTNGVADIFVRDRQAGTTERVSVATSGTEANGASSTLSISGDGRYVAFASTATSGNSGDDNIDVQDGAGGGSGSDTCLTDGGDSTSSC